ncbi:MAG: 50S ribosomal protein L11 methyltransferase [Proteobacteria bacterium]|nr:50S ribosomal protein L11 methyltransferase [Pseudomonadota bacterium]MBU1687374.1 50S ribosomal protein L11 methyltransferase [Pseudomonadota bacterium]
MLQPPYTKYQRLYVYHLDGQALPEVNDPDLIGTWVEDGTPILFFHRPKERLIKEICLRYGCNVIYEADLDYVDWEAGQQIASYTVEGITIVPEWEEGVADIRLDPSVIFGSGFHPSTRLCLETLIKYCRTPEFAPRTMLDLGTGTGLLAIAAAWLGVESITAFDNNPLACRVAEKNIRLNNFEKRITVAEADLRKSTPDTRVDLVVANLYHTLLAGLFQKPSFWQAQLYIFAGFIPSMEQELLASLPPHRTQMVERRRMDRWCLWVIKPKTAPGTSDWQALRP